MATYSYAKTTPTTTSPDLARFTQIVDSLTNIETIDYVSDGTDYYYDSSPASDVRFYSHFMTEYNVYQLTMQIGTNPGKSVYSVDSTRLTYADLQHLGAAPSGDLYVFSYLRGSSLYYIVYDASENYWKNEAVATDATSIDKLYIGSDGDLLYQYQTAAGTRYALVDSGYVLPNAAPVSSDFTDTTSRIDLITIAASSLATDGDSDPLTISDFSVSGITTSDASTGSVLIAQDADGNLVMLYTGALPEGETAEVTVSFDITDGTATTAGTFVITVTGAADGATAITRSALDALMGAYASPVDLGAITELALKASAADLLALTDEDIVDFTAFGVTAIDATDTLTLDLAGALRFIEGGLSFTRGDVIIADTAEALAEALDVATITELGNARVMMIQSTDADFEFSLAQANAFRLSGMQWGGTFDATLVDTQATLEAMTSSNLKNMGKSGINRIDSSSDMLNVRTDITYAMQFERMSFVADDDVTVMLNIKELLIYDVRDYQVLANLGVDKVDFNDGQIAATQSIVNRITKAGLEIADGMFFVPTEGNDQFKGTFIDDRVEGLGGNDRLSGNEGDDTLFGGENDDILRGGDDDDTLRGGGGNDTLFGGLGVDRMYGGAGKDVFVFESASDLGADIISSDIIFNLRRSQGDQIDLSLVDANVRRGGDQDFAFIGRSDFSGKAGELRFTSKAGVHVLQADTDGDRNADIVLTVESDTTLSTVDLIL